MQPFVSSLSEYGQHVDTKNFEVRSRKLVMIFPSHHKQQDLPRKLTLACSVEWYAGLDFWMENDTIH